MMDYPARTDHVENGDSSVEYFGNKKIRNVACSVQFNEREVNDMTFKLTKVRDFKRLLQML